MDIGNPSIYPEWLQCLTEPEDIDPYRSPGDKADVSPELVYQKFIRDEFPWIGKKYRE